MILPAYTGIVNPTMEVFMTKRPSVRSRMLAAIALLSAIIVGLPLGASACSCAPPPAADVARDQADAVFAGRVIGLRLVPQAGSDPAALSFSIEDLEVTMLVHSLWKGDVSEEQRLFTTFTCCVCGFRFEIGEEYLVYATLVEGVLRTSMCTRTALLSAASEDLGILGDLRPVLIDASECNEGQQP